MDSPLDLAIDVGRNSKSDGYRRRAKFQIGQSTYLGLDGQTS
jgi:hypothetical protein